MKALEEELTRQSLRCAQYQAAYFQAKDELRKANKGLACLSRNNQNLRNKIMSLLAQLNTPQHQDTFTREIAEVMRGAVPATNGNGNGKTSARLVDAIKATNSHSPSSVPHGISGNLVTI